ncbi:MAG: Holliday junction branch migration protein RuvA [Christensenellaceae bacterium]|jgi:Holliday junction DNA helicase RuvA|nr:Holliday junction branch migration protein RuvA [Christensenellaceae bacterium]
MYDYIKGKLTQLKANQATVEAGGLGFLLAISALTASKLPAIDAECKIFCEYFIKDDRPVLYGFSDKDERTLFNSLISVSGVGAKTALAILSGMPLSKLVLAIASKDSKTISKVKGVGKKTAERIILELSERVATQAQEDDSSFSVFETNPSDSSIINDAVAALKALGISQSDAYKAVSQAKGDTVEVLIASALKFI